MSVPTLRFIEDDPPPEGNRKGWTGSSVAPVVIGQLLGANDSRWAVVEPIDPPAATTVADRIRRWAAKEGLPVEAVARRGEVFLRLTEVQS